MDNARRSRSCWGAQFPNPPGRLFARAARLLGLWCRLPCRAASPTAWPLSCRGTLAACLGVAPGWSATPSPPRERRVVHIIVDVTPLAIPPGGGKVLRALGAPGARTMTRFWRHWLAQRSITPKFNEPYTSQDEPGPVRMLERSGAHRSPDKRPWLEGRWQCACRAMQEPPCRQVHSSPAGEDAPSPARPPSALCISVCRLFGSPESVGASNRPRRRASRVGKPELEAGTLVAREY
jgi:hypothetical protein